MLGGSLPRAPCCQVSQILLSLGVYLYLLLAVMPGFTSPRRLSASIPNELEEVLRHPRKSPVVVMGFFVAAFAESPEPLRKQVSIEMFIPECSDAQVALRQLSHILDPITESAIVNTSATLSVSVLQRDPLSTVTRCTSGITGLNPARKQQQAAHQRHEAPVAASRSPRRFRLLSRATTGTSVVHVKRHLFLESLK
ncbi:hypothetical protein EDB83DRAFT_371721 [Lactarius deliciosus]|nr:hypothetical protein EDB83DRAFT_371721 [Lactarius deliciosus]